MFLAILVVWCSPKLNFFRLRTPFPSRLPFILRNDGDVLPDLGMNQTKWNLVCGLICLLSCTTSSQIAQSGLNVGIFSFQCSSNGMFVMCWVLDRAGFLFVKMPAGGYTRNAKCEMED